MGRAKTPAPCAAPAALRRKQRLTSWSLLDRLNPELGDSAIASVITSSSMVTCRSILLILATLGWSFAGDPPGVTGAAAGAPKGAAPDPAAAKARDSFHRELKPLLAKNCLRCHGPEKPKRGL